MRECTILSSISWFIISIHIGPVQVPCPTPDVTFTSSDNVCPTLTFCVLCVRKFIERCHWKISLYHEFLFSKNSVTLENIVIAWIIVISRIIIARTYCSSLDFYYLVFEEVTSPIMMKLSEATHWDPIEDPMKFHDVSRSPEVVMSLQRLNRPATTADLAQSNPVRWRRTGAQRRPAVLLSALAAIMSEAAGCITQCAGSQAWSAGPWICGH